MIALPFRMKFNFAVIAVVKPVVCRHMINALDRQYYT
jgi:hypothetical protein